MTCFDWEIWLGRSLGPALRKPILQLRRLQPNVTFRDRGIGNYGDYCTPERVVPGDKQAVDAPWFVIHLLGRDFLRSRRYQAQVDGWIVHNLVDSVARGGGFMVGVSPTSRDQFHPEPSADTPLPATG